MKQKSSPQVKPLDCRGQMVSLLSRIIRLTEATSSTVELPTQDLSISEFKNIVNSHVTAKKITYIDSPERPNWKHKIIIEIEFDDAERSST